MPTKRLRAAFISLIVTSLALAGCGGGKEAKAQPPKANTSRAPSTTPPANYTVSHIRQSLITPKDVDPNSREGGVSLLSLSKRAIPMCSLSGIKPAGKPDTIIREFANSSPQPGARYAQFISHYGDPQSAGISFEAVSTKAKSCPDKQHVPPKRLTEDFIQLEHDDTWRVVQGDIQGWKHLRGVERQVVSASRTKLNVTYLVYDYVVRGNTLLATLYWQRTDPKKSGDPIVKRATEVLTKQLQKIG